MMRVPVRVEPRAVISAAVEAVPNSLGEERLHCCQTSVQYCMADSDFHSPGTEAQITATLISIIDQMLMGTPS